MALYTIGDLHLSLAKEKPMDIFGDNWRRHEEKLRESFSRLGEDDLTVLCGDLSWGMSLEETGPDFAFVDSLPGKKLILKGNHDYWWTTAAKTKRFFAERGITTIDILHNNAFVYGEYAICGTRGWFYEEERGGEHDGKIMRREIMRLEASLKAAGERQKLVFLHYPPIYGNYRCEEILTLLKEHHVPLCYYGHIHGKGCAWAYNGWHEGTQFKLVSADFVNFSPVPIPIPEAF
jgi:predicted phosphohydrolase